LAAVAGVSFVALMLLAQWWWAEFLLTPHARNFVFGADQWDYYIKPGDWRYEFWTEEGGLLEMARGLAIATVTAIVSARLGLWIGRGMARVQR
jgi:ABC-type spermidine/putrescine transport system permease subunit II